MGYLIDEILNSIKKVLVEEFNPIKIFLFGSYAYGTPNKDSDLDILVLIEHSNESKTKRATRAYRAIRTIDVNIPLDLIVRTKSEFEPFTNITATIQNQIYRKGIVIYGN